MDTTRIGKEGGFNTVPAAPVTSTRIGSFAIGASGGGGGGELREGSGSGGLGVALEEAATKGERTMVGRYLTTSL